MLLPSLPTIPVNRTLPVRVNGKVTSNKLLFFDDSVIIIRFKIYYQFVLAKHNKNP